MSTGGNADKGGQTDWQSERRSVREVALANFYVAHSLSAMDRDWPCLRTTPLIGNNSVGYGRQQSPFPARNSAVNAKEASDRVCLFVCTGTQLGSENNILWPLVFIKQVQEKQAHALRC